MTDYDPSITADPLAHTHYRSFSLLTQSCSVSAPLHTPIGAAEELFSSSPQSMTLASCQLLSITGNLRSGEKFVCEGGRTHAKYKFLSLLRLQCFSPADTVAFEFTRTSIGLHRQASATARKYSAMSILPGCFCLSFIMTKAEGFLSCERCAFLTVSWILR